MKSGVEGLQGSRNFYPGLRELNENVLTHIFSFILKDQRALQCSLSTCRTWRKLILEMKWRACKRELDLILLGYPIQSLRHAREEMETLKPKTLQNIREFVPANHQEIISLFSSYVAREYVIECDVYHLCFFSKIFLSLGCARTVHATDLYAAKAIRHVNGFRSYILDFYGEKNPFGGLVKRIKKQKCMGIFLELLKKQEHINTHNLLALGSSFLDKNEVAAAVVISELVARDRSIMNRNFIEGFNLRLKEFLR